MTSHVLRKRFQQFLEHHPQKIQLRLTNEQDPNGANKEQLEVQYKPGQRDPFLVAESMTTPTLPAKKPASRKPMKKASVISGKHFEATTAKEALKSMRTLNDLIQDALPGVQVPEWIKRATWQKQVEFWKHVTTDGQFEERLSELRDIKSQLAQKSSQEPMDMAFKNEAGDARIQAQKRNEATERDASNALIDRHRTVVRLQKYMDDIEKETKSYVVRRKETEERLVKRLMEESMRAQRECMLELRRYRKDQDKQKLQQKLMRAEARRQYLRDQVDMLQEELRRVREQDQLKEKDLKEELREVKRQQKKALKRRIGNIKLGLRHDGSDFYFRERDVENAVERSNILARQ